MYVYDHGVKGASQQEMDPISSPEIAAKFEALRRLVTTVALREWEVTVINPMQPVRRALCCLASSSRPDHHETFSRTCSRSATMASYPQNPMLSSTQQHLGATAPIEHEAPPAPGPLPTPFTLTVIDLSKATTLFCQGVFLARKDRRAGQMEWLLKRFLFRHPQIRLVHGGLDRARNNARRLNAQWRPPTTRPPTTPSQLRLPPPVGTPRPPFAPPPIPHLLLPPPPTRTSQFGLPPSVGTPRPLLAPPPIPPLLPRLNLVLHTAQLIEVWLQRPAGLDWAVSHHT
jgi:hypothetical protein